MKAGKSPAARQARRPPSGPAGKDRGKRPGKSRAGSDDATDEVSALIKTLVATGQRLEELTAGEVDSVAGRDGRMFLLQRAQEQLRQSEAAKQAAILNALPAHIALLDSQGLIISVNEAPSIVAAVINMGRSLKLRVGAEGVETREELAFLQAHQCDEAQGSHFSAPVRPEQLAGLLRSGIPGTSSLRPPERAA